MSEYAASKAISEDLTGWSVLFRHPAVIDPDTDMPGRSMRYGLATRNDLTADRLITQLNEILADERWWTLSARQSAYSWFDERVVDIFYESMDLEATETTDSRAIRDQVLPLPTREDGYRHVLLIGTTGAGKTTMLRQLLGTDPEGERFPTTATARTTIADTEFVLQAGKYSTVITFFSLDEISRHLEDCVLQAVMAAHGRKGRSEVRRALLRHRDDRFRFNYILGDEPRANSADRPASVRAATSFASAATKVAAGMPELGELAQHETHGVIENLLDQVFELARRTADDLERTIDPRGTGDPETVADVIEERLEEILSGTVRVHAIVDVLVDEIQKRFALIGDLGELRCDKQGWPISWTWSTPDRSLFLRGLRRFTSNSKVGFGRLLTPLVDGVRVAGPFRPIWHQGPIPKLVFIDTEGLGHTVESAVSISTKFTQLIAEVDAVALVDSAAQPMQAAPATLLRSLAQTGQGSKLHLCFTHFDAVSGDNLPTSEDRTQHVLDSCEGVLAKISADLGLFADRPLRERVNEAAFFLADCHRALTREEDEFSVQEFRYLLSSLAESADRPPLAETRPLYNRDKLADAVRDAVEGFRKRWHVLLEQPPAPMGEGAHWKSIQALSRRFATMDEEEYGDLKPVADLQGWLQERSWLMIQSPIDWTEGEPSEAEMQTLYDKFAERLSTQMLTLARERIKEQRHQQWLDAYQQAGTGSAAGRAKIIEEIYAGAAPMQQPLAAHQDEFLHQVTEIVRATAAELDIRLT